ncbi:bifunctional 2-C-methyl-D-erythritol 4-phosphate cytidylyltransferase/2-C-methyl-D-erythritol 2,4-cyclodiphosphate synthase [Sphingomonas fennica]|uniref:Bifunctional enzyme IspD/IspF n=1 Tax=Edaphosphingomonas fennica TaxID=114404 RepID=A0A2T4HJ48_9SPHN|nr:bifunctional 2-C-methyl-D-erythritol 4-phosphate cytidylyltransferase/2-C-methyl-D-erythritol 2,4-cyclodiphosphate synthase [Sphingomonas fennica]PTD15828.1 bifunctional 2-C-methyl-D-erythritol 4-phosphate cytidylyltransferase/2-C-methyl-D-erythritol 2,4-cyclodiphosphate synthase [Sphingomonas fennica]
MAGGFDIVALIVAAGKGERAGGGLPKQYRPIGGKPMLAHAIQAFSRHPAIDRIQLVIGAGQETLCAEAMAASGAPPALFLPSVTGGATRRESVMRGLEAIGKARLVMIHDAARPFLPAAVIDRLVASLGGAEGAVPAIPVADTLARGGPELGEVVPRDGLVRVQTPQSFVFDAILAAHRAWPGEREATDDAQILRAAGHAVAIVAGDPALEKITFQEDVMTAEQRLGARMVTRVGMGFDVHAFADDTDLWLAGISIPHSRGLAGHSDADVALHAITDAMLGAIGDGDIGSHFPPSDPQWRGAASDRFVEHARGLIEAAGGVIDHVDLTIICEAPKIGPHRDAMRARVAALLRLPERGVSIKATTTERLGFTGRGEGIAAQAIVTVRVPEDR